MTDPRAESPQERVDYYVGQQVDMAHRLGADIDAEEARRGTARLLEVADAEARAPLVKDNDGKQRADVLAEKRLNTGEVLAEKAGGEFFFNAEPDPEPVARAKAPPPGGDGEKHMALMVRIAMLMAEIPGYRLKPGENVANRYQYPRFAMWLKATTDHAMLNDPKSVGAGIYAGLSLPDRHRLYLRRLEQICDQSNPVLGRGWWVTR